MDRVYIVWQRLDFNDGRPPTENLIAIYDTEKYARYFIDNQKSSNNINVKYYFTMHNVIGD